MNIFKKIKDFIFINKEIKRFKSLPKKDREIVFFAETPHDWVFFEGMVQSLTHNHHKKICYLTSILHDPILKTENDLIVPFYLGEGTLRTVFFQNIEAKIVIMALVDLDKYYLKRSIHPVHYVCVVNALVSAHMVTRNGAYDSFDSIFCGGPHQKKEIELLEKMYKLKKKSLHEIGYHRLDSLVKMFDQRECDVDNKNDTIPINVLIAPSWGRNSITTLCANELIEILLESGHRVTMRPHPMSVKQQPKVIKTIEDNFKTHHLFKLELDVRSKESLAESDVMISDWSGASFEYAFAFKRPVIFIDTPPKVMNKKYPDIDAIPLEISIRDEIGEVVSIDKLKDVPDKIKNICKIKKYNSDHFVKLREKHVYNVGNSGRVAADTILNILL